MSGYGLEEIHAPENTSIDIVFIHGLFGDRRSAWIQDSILWPQQLLPTDIPDARILVGGYETEVDDFNEGVNVETIKEHALQLCQNLVNTHPASSQQQQKPVIFVACDLGGFLCAQVIIKGLSAKQDNSVSTVANGIRGVIFIATPLQASSAVGYPDMLRRMWQLFQKTRPQEPCDLEKASKGLESLTALFAAELQKQSISGREVKISFFCEDVKTKGTLVVPLENAKIDGYEDPIKIKAEHINVAKFKSAEDEGYRGIVAAIKVMAQKQPIRELPSNSMTNVWNNSGNTKIGQQVGQQNITGGLTFN